MLIFALLSFWPPLFRNWGGAMHMESLSWGAACRPPRAAGLPAAIPPLEMRHGMSIPWRPACRPPVALWKRGMESLFRGGRLAGRLSPFGNASWDPLSAAGRLAGRLSPLWKCGMESLFQGGRLAGRLSSVHFPWFPWCSAGPILYRSQKRLFFLRESYHKL